MGAVPWQCRSTTVAIRERVGAKTKSRQSSNWGIGTGGRCQTLKSELVAANATTNSRKLLPDGTPAGHAYWRRRANIRPKAPKPSNAIELGSGATVNARYNTSSPGKPTCPTN